MSPRRIALALVGALVATTSALGATPARASSTTICVALVVDARSAGGNVSTDCATVKKGATGVDVLEAAGHTLTFRSDGLLCTIDGLPSSGCADVDESHYWAYFHRAPGATSWTYSSEGPSTYEPSNASTEGWVYDAGTSSTPDNVPYSQICKTKPTPKPTPTRTTKTHKPKPHHSRTPAPASTTSAASPTATPTRAPIRHHRTRDGTRGHLHRHPSYKSPGLRLSPRPSPAASSGVLTGSSPPTDGSSHSWVPIVIGGVVVLVIAGLAGRRFRRSP